MDRWSGRVVLVTGASVGIGAAVCRLLVKHGMKVAGCARSVEKIQAIKDELSGERGELLPIKCDLRHPDQIEEMFATIKATWGGVDVCVNNAGLAINSTLTDGSIDDWRTMTDVNILALCLCTQLTIKSMRERKVDDGHIIHISSMSGHRVTPTPPVAFYSATKFAVTGLTEGLRSQLRGEGSDIRVSAISPGFVETEFVERMYNKERAQQIYGSMKCIQAEDIANSVVYVLSQPKHVQVHDILMRPTNQPS